MYTKQITLLGTRLLLFSILLNSTITYAQDKLSFGVSGAYNFPLNSIGIGLRGQVPILPKVFVVPQLKYFPSFNTIHELYGGLNLHYAIIEGNQRPNGFKRSIDPEIPLIYVAAGVQYNRLINYVENVESKAKPNNFLPEVGLGTSVGGYPIRLFAERKYNILWNESYGEVGI